MSLDASEESLINLSVQGEAGLTSEMWAHGENFTEVATRYDVGTMSGTEVLHFANDVIATGVDQTDAMAVTWPINYWNLLHQK